MKFYVGVTDDRWYEFLAARQPDEVNFWHPGGTQGFRAIGAWAPFLFKLHSPRNFIAGGGFFVRHLALPLALAWGCFEEKNGCADIAGLRRMIQTLRRDQEPNPSIGCSVLAEPFFLPPDAWIPVPPDWARNIVSGKTYESTSGHGAPLWAAVQERLEHLPRSVEGDGQGLAEQPRYGAGYLAQPRLGQGAFRALVTDAYGRRCAMTGERTLPVLEAGHIQPYAEQGPHLVRNGILLRSDLHTLFDQGYLTLDPQLRICVSRRLRDEFDNGRQYYQLAGQPLLVVPGREDERPSPNFLEWHREHRFAC
jgi:putative restriction endonuclease